MPVDPPANTAHSSEELKHAPDDSCTRRRHAVAVQRTPHQPWTDNRTLFLDRLSEELRTGGTDTTSAMDRLSDGLWWFRRDQPSIWSGWATEAVRHPVSQSVHQDPFTYRSFEKPRGYAGDAALLDLIYYDQGFRGPGDVTELGGRIYWRNRNAPAPNAVRERRNHLAELIDRTSLRLDQARVLSVACGHLREGLLSSGLAARRIGRLVALDHDAESLAEVARSFHPASRVEPIQQTMRALLVSGLDHGLDSGRFDCIYAAGLYDYLETPVAIRLTTALFHLLAPGGRLVLANFAPDIVDAGYMETYMGWRLIYRT